MRGLDFNIGGAGIGATATLRPGPSDEASEVGPRAQTRAIEKPTDPEARQI